MTPAARDRLAPFFREAILDIKGVRPFPHQAAFWAAIDGLVLTDEVTGFWGLETPSDLRPYFDARTPIPHDATDVLAWSGDEDSPQYRIERRTLLPRQTGAARFSTDLAAYKAGKSFEGGILIASELLVPHTAWDIIGMQYTICEPEFLYVADVLLGDTGFNLPVKGQNGFNGKTEDGKPYPSLWCTSFQNSVGVGRMKIALSNGSLLECKSWESGEGLKGKERDGYLWAESYQFGTIKPFATLKQNLKARDGKSLFPTTPDHAWVDILREMGESDHKHHRQWFCLGNVERKENPFTYDADEMEADRGIMTREQHAISWEGKLGTYIGSVYEYRRGEREFNCETHPELWRDVRLGPIPSNLMLPASYNILGGGDTGTRSAACWAAFSDDDPAQAFFIAEVCNYRYVATQIEELKGYSMLQFYEAVHTIAARLGCRPSLYADPNSQFKSDWWNTGAVRLLKGTPSQEHRTERLRSLFQHNRVWIAPWMEILPYELEVAKYPPEETSTGKWARVKRNDHMLDGAEHLGAQDPSGKPLAERKPLLAIEQILGVRRKPAAPVSPWGI